MRVLTGSILIAATLLALSGCASDAPPAAPGPRVPVALSLGRVLIDLPVGHKAGAYEFGLLCKPPYNEVAWVAEGRMPGLLTQAVRDGLSGGGLGLTEGAARTLTGRLVDVDLSLCRRIDGIFNKEIGDTGEGRVRIDWELTDPPGPIRRWTTEGRGETDIPALNGRYDVILRDATGDAARHLAELPEFRALVAGTPAGLPTGMALTSAPSAPVAMPVGPDAPSGDAAATPGPGLPTAAAAAAEPSGSAEGAGAALVRAGSVTGAIVDRRGLALLPDTGGRLPNPVPLMLADGRVVEGVPTAQALGFNLVTLPAGDWPALAVRRQRPAVSHWLHRPDGEGAPAVALVAAHTGPPRAQGTDVQSLLLDLDPDLGRNPPWILVDAEGRLAALRGPRALPGDPAPYYAPAGVMAHFRAITGLGGE